MESYLRALTIPLLCFKRAKWYLHSTSWQIDREIKETVTDFIFLGSKITTDCDCSHEIKRCLLLGRKAMTNLNENLDGVLKSRDITLLTKVCIVKAMVFPAVMHRCESWTIKTSERQITEVFELWCWKRLNEFLGLQRDQTSQSRRKSTLNIRWKD